MGRRVKGIHVVHVHFREGPLPLESVISEKALIAGITAGLVPSQNQSVTLHTLIFAFLHA